MALKVQARILLPNQTQVNWNDKGSGADFNVQTWTPQAPSDFFTTGDMAEASAGSWIYDSIPRGTLVALRDVSTNGDVALRNPTSFARIWKDSGSGADRDGSFWQPDSKGDFMAVGSMVMFGHDNPPNGANYVLVHKNLLIQAASGPEIWDDTGSGADKDVALWRTVVAATAPTSIVTGAFTAFETHNRPNNNGFMALNPNFVEWVV